MRVEAAKVLWYLTKSEQKCGKVHLITIFNMANSSFQGKDFHVQKDESPGLKP
jgi:hypothetical protein